ncbi:putative phosphatase regulatory subunit-domain-containing protein [Geopyxis carbonaria]|nr:putative phosphatase regulatory subunit-domain-containing protein [Geopyxis carbonaria]
MPYTPPSQSPGPSRNTSRSSSFSNHDQGAQSTRNLINSPNPPRSATYLHKHRRSSSVSTPSLEFIPAANRSSTSLAFKDPRSESLHQSPPPVDDGMSLIPKGAVMSPPDSQQNSSDEDESVPRRGRDLGLLEDQLVEALQGLGPQRSASPDASMPRKPPSPLDSSMSMSRRRISHRQTYSDSAVLIDIGVRSAGSGRSSRSDSMSDIEDDAYRIAPAMVRKKSGEVVKSSLKSPSRSRPISMPSTPTFPSKNVHFDSRIEHVRHFLHSEKPSAVSAGSSPVETAYDGESEYPFGPNSPEFDWEIILPNFPKDLESRKSMPVRLEKVCLSTDKQSLIGTIACVNMAFQKHVVTRFTFDYWQTVSEVTAEYSSDVRRKDREDGADRFVFKIKLAEQANLEKKTLFFCIRYCTAGQEHWDNNAGFNFHVDFKKTPKAQTARATGPRLPRSRPVSAGSRPRSMPNLDDFGILDDAFFERARELSPRSTDPSPRSKSRKSAVIDDDTALPTRRANPSGNAFGNRYDFGASLNAAIKAAGTVTQKPAEVQHNEPKKEYFDLVPKVNYLSVQSSTTPMESPSISGAGHPEVIKPDVFFNTGKPSIESPSYRELLDNYCFFGTSKASSNNTHRASSEKKKKDVVHLQLQLPGNEKASTPRYTLAPSPPAMTIAQHNTSGNTSPITPNYAGFHHKRRQSGAFRFDATKTPTAIC